MVDNLKYPCDKEESCCINTGKPPSNIDITCIKSMLRHGQKVMAIKAYRRYTGCCLTYAKQRVDEIESEMQG